MVESYHVLWFCFAEYIRKTWFVVQTNGSILKIFGNLAILNFLCLLPFSVSMASEPYKGKWKATTASEPYNNQ